MTDDLDFSGLDVDDTDTQSLRFYHWLDDKRMEGIRKLTKWRFEQRVGDEEE